MAGLVPVRSGRISMELAPSIFAKEKQLFLAARSGNAPGHHPGKKLVHAQILGVKHAMEIFMGSERIAGLLHIGHGPEQRTVIGKSRNIRRQQPHGKIAFLEFPEEIFVIFLDDMHLMLHGSVAGIQG